MESLKELYAQQREIEEKIFNHKVQRLKQQLQLNHTYVGKCYKKITRPALGEEYVSYFKVVSEYATNEFWLTILRFSEHPRYKFIPHAHMQRCYDDYITGNFDGNFIYLDKIMIEGLGRCEEISEKEFSEKMKAAVEELNSAVFSKDKVYIGEEYIGEDL